MPLQGAKLLLAPPAWRLLAGSLRLRPSGPRSGGPDDPVIFACLHRDLIPAIAFVRPRRPVLLVSRSPDGDILRRVLGPWGYRFVRGSTGKDGGLAAAALLRALRGGLSVGVAVDGPRGPFGEVREGVVRLSSLSGRPIVPLGFRPGRHLALGNWDRTVVPWPLSRVEASEGEPLRVPAGCGGAEAERWRRELSARLLAGAPTVPLRPAARGSASAEAAGGAGREGEAGA